jgi:D-alanine transaminase
LTRIVYVDGRYLRYAQAAVHVEDRGFQFADAVYEVIEVKAGHLVDETAHLDRLERNLAELAIPPPVHRGALSNIMRQTLARNRVCDGLVYLQVTRGEAPRDFLYAGLPLDPTLVCIARRVDPDRVARQAAAGIGVKSMPDVRWARCDIKTVMLLPAVLAKEAARGEDAREAWFLDKDGFVTEGASSNAWIVDGEGRILTRGLGRDILPGITRSTLMRAIEKAGLPVVERPFTIAEAYRAREAFNTAATATVMPVVRIDGHPIGDGRPGPITQRLRSIFHSAAACS